MHNEIRFKPLYKAKLIGYILFFLTLPIIMVPIINGRGYPNPNILIYTTIFSGIGSALMFAYILYKVNKTEVPIQITRDVVNINWPKKIHIQIQNIEEVEIDKGENITIKLVNEIKNSKDKKVTINTSDLNTTAKKLSEHIKLNRINGGY